MFKQIDEIIVEGGLEDPILNFLVYVSRMSDARRRFELRKFKVVEKGEPLLEYARERLHELQEQEDEGAHPDAGEDCRRCTGGMILKDGRCGSCLRPA